MAETQKPIVEHRKVVKQGGSRYIAIPLGWFEANSLDPDNLDLLIVANKDIRIVNPEHEAAVYAEISRITKEAKTQKEE
jgi:hypothetical protein